MLVNFTVYVGVLPSAVTSVSTTGAVVSLAYCRRRGEQRVVAVGELHALVVALVDEVGVAGAGAAAGADRAVARLEAGALGLPVASTLLAPISKS